MNADLSHAIALLKLNLEITEHNGHVIEDEAERLNALDLAASYRAAINLLEAQ